MTLAVGSIGLGIGAKPAPYNDWAANASLRTASTHAELGSAEALEAFFLRSWDWARRAEKHALQRAAEASPLTPAGKEAQRIADRHHGVWRCANKLERPNPNGGPSIRAVSAIRSDSGDSTCPTYLLRQGKIRASSMLPVIDAVQRCRFTVQHASSAPMPRHVAKRVIADLKQRNFIGLDVLTIPSSRDNVVIHVLVAIWQSEPFTINFDSIGIYGVKLDFFTSTVDLKSWYCQTANAANILGPEIWIDAQLARLDPITGKRTRDRVTQGCFYGDNAESMIESATSLAQRTGNEIVIAKYRRAHALVETCLDIANRAIESYGNKIIAQDALSLAKAYITESWQELSDYPCLIGSMLLRVNKVSLHGLIGNSINSLEDIKLNDELMDLPSVLNRADFITWQSIERVAVNSKEDIASLARWAKAV